MRIAHLTDPHIRHHLPGSSSIPRRHSRLMLACLAQAMARLADLRPDLLVVTGDLLDYPLEYAADPRFRSLAWADLMALRRVLAEAPCPRIVLPGNHDLEELCERAFPPVQECIIAGHRVLAFYDREGEGHVPRRVAGERARFCEALERRDGVPQVHVQHYVVWPERNQGYPHTYGDGDALRRRIVQSGRVRLVLSGHYHAGVPPFCEEGVWFAVAPALCQAPYRFWVYDLANGSLTWQEHALEE